MAASTPLSLVRDRERAAAVLGAARHLPAVDAVTVVDSIDAVCAALLRAAGLCDPAARAVLAALWDDPVPSGALDVPPRTPRRTELERLRCVGTRWSGWSVSWGTAPVGRPQGQHTGAGQRR